MRIRLLVIISTLLVTGFAPAPLPMPCWVKGWDRPVDPLGDCRFDRVGEKLLITVPGKGHDLEGENNRLTAPCLLRDVEGDFVVQVRVGGNFRLANLERNGVVQAAGLFVTDGEEFINLERVTGLCTPSLALGRGVASKGKYNFALGRSGMGYEKAPSLAMAMYLRLERRGSILTAASSLDGKKWEPTKNGKEGVDWSRQKLKVGVVAEVVVGAGFTAEFDRFELILLKK